MALNALSTPARNAACNAVVDLVDGGSADPNGDITIHTAGYAVLLAELQFDNPAFGNAANGVATAGAIADDGAANNTGTADVLRIRDRDNTQIVDGTVGTVGEDLNLNTDSIVAADIISITAATLTMPAA